MVIGAAGELPKPPEKPIVFLEGARVSHCHRERTNDVYFSIYPDMDDSELAEAVRSALTRFCGSFF
jgi:hypothetical protein